MLRELQTILDKPASSQYYSSEETVITGMGVVKDQDAGTFGFPSAATAADIFVVDKERVPKGYKAAASDLSDYDEDYVTVLQGEYGILISYHAGERFAIDQYDGDDLSGYTIGDRLGVGTDGKWTAASGTSKYVYAGEYDDAGHTLMLIEVSDTPA